MDSIFKRPRLNTAVASEAKQSIRQKSKSGLLRRFAPRNDDKIYLLVPRRIAPELCINDPPKERAWRYPKGERGMPGARCTRSLVRKV